MKCYIATVTLFLSLFGGTAWAQDVCPDSGNAGTVQYATLYLRTDDTTCTAVDGTYMKTSSTAYDVDIAMEVTGHCQVRINQCSGVPPVCQCVDGPYQFRYIGATILKDNGSQLGSQINPSNLNNIQLLDTRAPTGTSSTGNNWLNGTYEGIHLITSSTAWSNTTCNWTPTSFAASLTVNAVKCEPTFLETNGHITHLDPAASTIHVYLPTAMSGASTALHNAVNEWTSALSGTGVALDVVTSSCGTGADCITVTTSGSLTPCGLAQATGVDPDTGAITAGMTLTIRSDWNTRTCLPPSKGG